MILARFVFISLLFHLSFWGAFWFVKSREPRVYDLTDISLLEGTTQVSASPPTSLPPLKVNSDSQKSSHPIQTPEVSSATKDSQELPKTPQPSPENATSSFPSTENFAENLHGDYASLTRLPKIKNEVRVEYPSEAKESGISGSVVLEVIIGKDGQVKAAKIVKGPGHGLDEAALKAITQFEFQPAFKDKEPVAVKIQYTYRFKLDIN